MLHSKNTHKLLSPNNQHPLNQHPLFPDPEEAQENPGGRQEGELGSHQEYQKDLGSARKGEDQ